MKGLILKDVFTLKKQAGFYLLIQGALMLISLFNPGMRVFAGVYFVVIGMMMPITALAYDERAQWNKLALTMPVKRSSLVISKYLLGLILLAAAVLLTVLFMGGYGAVTGWQSYDITEVIMLISLSMVIGFIMLSALMPVMFKVGTEKGRIVMMLMIFIPIGLLMGLTASGVFPTFDDNTISRVVNTFFVENPALTFLGIAVISIGLLCLSMAISCSIIKKKEF